MAYVLQAVVVCNILKNRMLKIQIRPNRGLLMYLSEEWPGGNVSKTDICHGLNLQDESSSNDEAGKVSVLLIQRNQSNEGGILFAPSITKGIGHGWEEQIIHWSYNVSIRTD